MNNNSNNQRSAPSAKIIRLGEGAFITVVMDGESLTLRASDSQESFDKALEACKAEDWDLLYTCMRPVKKYVSEIKGVEINENGVFYNGEIINNTLSKRILDFALSGLDSKPLCKFLEKLMNNPSRRAVNELYTFLEHQNLPITDNGNFLAYKGLLSNYYSITSGSAQLIQGTVKSGSIYNGIGEVIEMKRNDVDDDKDRGCSYGLHAGTMEYASGFAQGKCVIVEINPADVVSIPVDCNFQKLRTCKYKVVGEYEAPLVEPLYASNWIEDDIGDEDWSDCDCVDCDCVETTETTETTETAEASETTLDTSSNPIEVFAFDTPNSSWIDFVEWGVNEELDRVLSVVLRTGESMDFIHVPLWQFSQFQKSVESGQSAGKFFHQFIKSVYEQIQY